MVRIQQLLGSHSHRILLHNQQIGQLCQRTKTERRNAEALSQKLLMMFQSMIDAMALQRSQTEQIVIAMQIMVQLCDEPTTHLSTDAPEDLAAALIGQQTTLDAMRNACEAQKLSLQEKLTEIRKSLTEKEWVAHKLVPHQEQDKKPVSAPPASKDVAKASSDVPKPSLTDTVPSQVTDLVGNPS